MIPTSDLHVGETRPLVAPALLHRELPLSDRAAATVREARERARQIEDQAAKRANEAIETARQAAQTEGARIVDAAREEAVTETHRARDDLRREYGSLVVAGAAQLLEREVDAKAHAQLIDKLAAESARG